MKSRSELTDIPLNSGYRDGLCTETAIIGAGAAGLYSAWRLVTGGGPQGAALPGASVQVFEMDDRIGGRLESVALPGMDLAGELGGMRYLPGQAIIATLAERVFGHTLRSVPFPVAGGHHRFAFLRQQHLRADAWSAAQARGERHLTRYMLNEADIGHSPAQLCNKVAYDVLTADPWFMARYADKVRRDGAWHYVFELDAADWSKIKRQLRYRFPGPYYDAPLGELGFWNLLKDRLGQEGYQFLADASGHDAGASNWNAAEALPFMAGNDAGGTEQGQGRTIAGGCDGIAYALANAYLAEPGSCIWRENQLLGFSRSSKPGYRYTLQFVNRPGRAPWTVHANSIVLAMPRRALALLRQDNFFFRSDELQRNLDAVTAEPAYRILLGFEHPWWRTRFGALAGHAVTDQPLHETRYAGADPARGHSLVVGSYNGRRAAPFWQVLARHPVPFVPRPTAHVAPARLQGLQDVQASQRMVDEVLQQLGELHGMAIPKPYVTWCKDWSADPYGGGYHAWQAGYPVERVMQFMRRPDRAEAIHIVGEAYSEQQGWVEGAFCVAERMLLEHFGLRRPQWLSPAYHLGN